MVRMVDFMVKFNLKHLFVPMVYFKTLSDSWQAWCPCKI